MQLRKSIIWFSLLVLISCSSNTTISKDIILIDSNDNITISDCLSSNIFKGLPTLKDEKKISHYAIVCRKNYILGYNKRYKTPIWVAEHLSSADKGNVGRSSKGFKPDRLLKLEDSAKDKDYRNSCLDRGHMTPSNDHQSDIDSNLSTFYFSNIVPQNPYHNKEIWKYLEDSVRVWAEKSEKGLYVYTGPIYIKNKPLNTIGMSQVAIPDKLYKVIIDPVKMESVAYIIPNKRIKFSDLPKYRTTIKKVETQTDLDFGPSLNIQEAVELESRISSGFAEIQGRNYNYGGTFGPRCEIKLIEEYGMQ